MKNTILKISKHDAAKAGSYMDNWSCLVCTAVRRQFKLPGNARIFAGGLSVGYKISDAPPVIFAFDKKAGHRIAAQYEDKGTGESCPKPVMKRGFSVVLVPADISSKNFDVSVTHRALS